jgi:hypothetical protein
MTLTISPQESGQQTHKRPGESTGFSSHSHTRTQLTGFVTTRDNGGPTLPPRDLCRVCVPRANSLKRRCRRDKRTNPHPKGAGDSSRLVGSARQVGDRGTGTPASCRRVENTRTGYARPPAPKGAGGASTVDGEEVERACMLGDAAGAIMQREAKSVQAMAPARPLGPIRWDGRAAGGSQSGRRSSKGCVCVPCKGGLGSACGGRLVSTATWPSVVKMSAELY